MAEGRNHQMPTYCVNGSLDVFTAGAEAILNDRLFLDGHHRASPALPCESVLKQASCKVKPFCLRTKMEYIVSVTSAPMTRNGGNFDW